MSTVEYCKQHMSIIDYATEYCKHLSIIDYVAEYCKQHLSIIDYVTLDNRS